MVEAGSKVLSRVGAGKQLVGQTTGSGYRCRMEGCTGRRIGTRWTDGKVTFPCSKGIEFKPDGTLQIL